MLSSEIRAPRAKVYGVYRTVPTCAMLSKSIGPYSGFGARRPTERISVSSKKALPVFAPGFCGIELNTRLYCFGNVLTVENMAFLRPGVINDVICGVVRTMSAIANLLLLYDYP